MSWIQHFFERFKKEEESVQHEIHTKKQMKPDHKQQSAIKDLEARITYQYPKGQFRFPVIPDDKPIRRDKDIQLKKDIDHHNDQAEKWKQPKPKQRDHSNKDQIKRIQKEAARVKEAPKVNFHSSGPFRPTDIPSPIFGFNRPKKTAIEYELSQFATNIETKEDASAPEAVLDNRESETNEKAPLFDRLVVRENEIDINEMGLEQTGELESAIAEAAVSMAADQLLEPTDDLEVHNSENINSLNNDEIHTGEKFDSLDHDEASMDEKFDSLDHDEASMDEKFDSLDHDEASMDEKFDSLDHDEASMDEKFDSLDHDEASMDEKFDSLDHDEASMDEKFDSLDHDEASMDEKFDSLDHDEASMDEKFDSLDHDEASMDEKFDSLDHDEASMDEKFDSLDHDEASMDEKFDSLDHDEATMDEKVDSLDNDEVPMDEKVDSLNNEDRNIIENVETEENHEISSTEDVDTTQIEMSASIENLGTSEKEEMNSFENDTVTGETDTAVKDIILNKNEDQHSDAVIAEEAFTAEHVLTDSDTNPTEPEKPKRRHLPFNVMMLKQDKQKWEEKRIYQIKEQNTSSKPAISESIEKEAEEEEINNKEQEQYVNLEEGSYVFPEFQLLNPPIVEDMDTEWLMEQENLLNQTLENFNVGAKVVNMTQGPSVTRFEVQPEPGVKVNKVTNLSDDIKLSLAARDIRIEAPIPGKHTIGIEVPNQKSRPVQISEIIQSNVFHESSSPLTAVLGLDISGKPIVTDLKKMPHGLIAGATGSGKSVCINTILVSLLYKASPDDLKLLLIDPKMVELAPYNRIPHLVSPVITDVKAATAALKWAVDEMERRYELFAHSGVRDINRFNELAMQHKKYSDKLPFIVIIIDELADLMMMSPADVEEAICRIAQKARACGIHLIIATQRPSVDVITGLIKANIPTRIAFSVSSQVDSRTIIDISGAEKLLGRGDMLFLENGSSKPVRLQGTFVSDEEIDTVVAHVREQREPDYLFEQEELLKKAQMSEEEDELFYEACEFVVDQASASTSSLQRRFKIGYNRAARLMEMMEQQGYISSAKGSKPRDVFITAADLETIHESGI